MHSDSYCGRLMSLDALEEEFSSILPSDLDMSSLQGLSKNSSTILNGQKIVGKWKKEEDQNLIFSVNKYGTKNWKKVSAFVKGRTPIQCLHRWTKILQPGLIKGPWTIDEDRKLIEWVRKEGALKWSQCAEFIRGRSGKQCRERWFNTLCPHVKKGNWSPEEDFNIFQLYNKYGSQWSKITEYFKGRTENSIKNRFYSTLRRIATEKKKEKTKADNNGSETLSGSKLNELLFFLPYAMDEMNIKFLQSCNNSEKLNCNASSFNINFHQIPANRPKKNTNLNLNLIPNGSEANDRYHEFNKLPLNVLENNIEEMCSNKICNPFLDKSLTKLDSQINDFIDNFFDSKKNHLNQLEHGCYNCHGCQNKEENGMSFQNKNSESVEVLHSLVQQLNDLEKVLQSTKNELLMKKDFITNEDYNNFIRSDHNGNLLTAFSNEHLDYYLN